MIFDKTKELFIEVMGLDDDEVTLETMIYDELDADSLDMSQIILGLENHFSVDLPDDTSAQVERVSDLVKLVETARAAA
ncbi:acyl carrier protein [Fusibacter sp. JL216-2]|uniref:acyl carrier protein n=1 Tax=Fusibacter sp. JL216-2 TaxID=3071453 RepID=UPI003D32622A